MVGERDAPVMAARPRRSCTHQGVEALKLRRTPVERDDEFGIVGAMRTHLPNNMYHVVGWAVVCPFVLQMPFGRLGEDRASVGIEDRDGRIVHCGREADVPAVPHGPQAGG